MPHLVIAGLVLAALCAVPAEADPLVAHLGHTRMVVVFAEHADDPGLLAQRAIMAENDAGAADRDLVLAPIIGTDAAAIAMAKRYNTVAGRFQVILVGKDGSAYARSQSPISREELFARIDAMPMRKAERRERGR